MKFIHLKIIAFFILSTTFSGIQAAENTPVGAIDDLKNYQVNNPQMVSAGLPNKVQFKTLKEVVGVTKVIDLIPGDRTKESDLMKALSLPYYNIQVEWENPTVENFNEYVLAMKQEQGSDGVTLTHCRLNWRGAVFTYLYRVTQLNEPEELAKKDMLAIWEPNDVWTAFIKEVKSMK